MYALGGMMFPYMQDLGFWDETHLSIIDSPLNNMVMASNIWDYDIGGEGDLFKAPEPIIEEPFLELDPLTTAISTGENVISPESIEVENEGLLSDVFYECMNDVLVNSAIDDFFRELSDVNIQHMQTETSKHIDNDTMVGLASKKQNCGVLTRPIFLGFQEIDLETALVMRRAYSEGDIKTLGNGRTNFVKSDIPHPPIKRMLSIDSCKIEERQQKLSRYRKKKIKRNFGRKIKYACRKALADSQPRVHGRFAKTESEKRN